MVCLFFTLPHGVANQYVLSFWKFRVAIHPEVRELERILGYLTYSLKSIVALRCEPLFLRKTVEQFRESNSEIVYGQATSVVDDDEDDSNGE